MKRAILFLLVLGCAGAAPAPQDPAGSSFRLPVDELVLDNGFRVLVVERPGAPRVYCSLWWRVGSVNERPGITGLSHFFEHMMFMGTDVIGTTDAKKDAELNAKIEETMTKIRAIKLRRLEAGRRGSEPDPADEKSFEELWGVYKGLVAEQKKITIPEHLSKLFQAAGGTRLNATTSWDRTNFFVDLPANKVELFCWLESDRFLKPVFRSFYPEREVVKEERRMRTDSTPTGLAGEAYWSAFWQSHPYSWPVIGWMSDIDQYTLADAERYYRTHYSPENCSAIFVGDVKAADVKDLCRRYFGRLKRFPEGRDAIVTQEVEQTVERRLLAEVDAQDEVNIRWHGPSGVHRDSAAVDLLMASFAGRSGRFYRPLVEEKKLAVDVESSYHSLRYGGVIHVGATLQEGASAAELEKAMDAIVEGVRKDGISDRELQKVKNQQLADMVRQLKTSAGAAQQLGYFETIGTHRDFDAYMKNVESATAEDLKRCAGQYLKPGGKNVLVVKRKGKK